MAVFWLPWTCSIRVALKYRLFRLEPPLCFIFTLFCLLLNAVLYEILTLCRYRDGCQMALLLPQDPSAMEEVSQPWHDMTSGSFSTWRFRATTNQVGLAKSWNLSSPDLLKSLNVFVEHCVPGTVLGSKGSAVNDTDLVPDLMEEDGDWASDSTWYWLVHKEKQGQQKHMVEAVNLVLGVLFFKLSPKWWLGVGR